MSNKIDQQPTRVDMPNEQTEAPKLFDFGARDYIMYCLLGFFIEPAAACIIGLRLKEKCVCVCCLYYDFKKRLFMFRFDMCVST